MLSAAQAISFIGHVASEAEQIESADQVLPLYIYLSLKHIGV